MIASEDGKSSEIVDGFPSTMRVAAVSIADPERYRVQLHDAEWRESTAFEDWRRAEFVAGRAAARLALSRLLGSGADNAVIERDQDGAPVARRLADAPLLSISHGRATAVAVAARANALGIDICEHAVAFRVRRVIVRFVAEPEVTLVEGGGVAQWTALWALKEAAAKALRRGLLDGGLRATCLASVEPPRFAWPALDAVVVYRDADTIAIAHRA